MAGHGQVTAHFFLAKVHDYQAQPPAGVPDQRAFQNGL